MTEELSKYERYYNDIVGWQSFGCPEGFWGTEEHQEACWNAAIEELNEVSEAISSGDVANILKEICDLFVTVTPLVELFGTDIQQVMPPRASVESIERRLHKIGIILQGKKKWAVRDAMSLLCMVLDQMEEDHSHLQEVMRLVCESNWSKYPAVEELHGMYGDGVDEALKAASDWIETEYSHKGYKDVVGYVKGGRCLFRNDNGKGKVLKPWTYVECDAKIKETLIEGNNDE